MQNLTINKNKHLLPNPLKVDNFKLADIDLSTLAVFQTCDFHGLLKDLSMQEKKEHVLQTYKLIFRFSIDKLLNYLKNDSFLIMLLHYLQDTQLQRIH